MDVTMMVHKTGLLFNYLYLVFHHGSHLLGGFDSVLVRPLVLIATFKHKQYNYNRMMYNSEIAADQLKMLELADSVELGSVYHKGQCLKCFEFTPGMW